jgi:hypothetical protein
MKRTDSTDTNSLKAEAERTLKSCRRWSGVAIATALMAGLAITMAASAPEKPAVTPCIKASTFLLRDQNGKNVRATNVDNQALWFSCLVPVSSMFRCSWAGSWPANSS